MKAEMEEARQARMSPDNSTARQKALREGYPLSIEPSFRLCSPQISCCGPPFVHLKVTPPPSPATYHGMIIERFNNLEFTMDEEPMYFDAVVTVNPEPATLMLVGSGLAGVFGVVARRRRRR